MSKLKRELETILKATGLDWSIEPSKRHEKIILAGQQVGVISHGCKDRCDSKKIAATIRNTVKRMQQ